MFRDKFANDETELEKFVDLVFERVDMNRDVDILRRVRAVGSDET